MFMLFSPHIEWDDSTCMLKQKMAPTSKKKNHSRSFQDQWRKDPAFKDWLLKDYDENDSFICMKCLICSEPKQKTFSLQVVLTFKEAQSYNIFRVMATGQLCKLSLQKGP